MKKLEELAPSVADPPLAIFTIKQNPPICNPPLYITITFKPILWDVLKLVAIMSKDSFPALTVKD